MYEKIFSWIATLPTHNMKRSCQLISIGMLGQQQSYCRLFHDVLKRNTERWLHILRMRPRPERSGFLQPGSASLQRQHSSQRRASDGTVLDVIRWLVFSQWRMWGRHLRRQKNRLHWHRVPSYRYSTVADDADCWWVKRRIITWRKNKASNRTELKKRAVWWRLDFLIVHKKTWSWRQSRKTRTSSREWRWRCAVKRRAHHLLIITNGLSEDYLYETPDIEIRNA